MSWGSCGTDSKGRRIGYAQSAVCDAKGCTARIDRGLGYACGGMHGAHRVVDCEGYYCPEHLKTFVAIADDELVVCVDCTRALAADPLWIEDREEGIWRHLEDSPNA